MTLFETWWESLPHHKKDDSRMEVAEDAWNEAGAAAAQMIRGEADYHKGKTLYHPEMTLKRIADELAKKLASTDNNPSNPSPEQEQS